MEIIKLKNKKPKPADVARVVGALERGELTILPTETLYGAMVDATSPEAIKKLVAYKNRPFGKPFSIAVTNAKMASKYVQLNDTAKKLYKKYLPGPLTVVSRGKHTVAPGVESELGTLGIRIPDYKFILDIVSKFGKPITATSANASYKKRPYKVSDILDNLSAKQKKLIGLIIDAGTLPKREPSTVIDTTPDDPVVLRQGDIQIKNKVEVLSRSEENTQNIAKELWQKFEKFSGQRSIVFALQGPLGAGKTQFTKGLAKALGIKEEVTSPTFILESEYRIPKVKNKLLHIDVWRMQNPTELLQLGFDKSVNDKAVISIEWAEKVASVVREYEEEAIVVWVKIVYGKKGNERLISWGTL